jgi:hypothetical protein
MKKTITTIIAILALTAITLTTFASCGTTQPNTYEKDCVVFDLYRYGDEVAFIDTEDDIWTMIGEVPKGTTIGTKCTLVMDDLGTENMYDDEIIEVIWVE